MRGPEAPYACCKSCWHALIWLLAPTHTSACGSIKTSPLHQGICVTKSVHLYALRCSMHCRPVWSLGRGTARSQDCAVARADLSHLLYRLVKTPHSGALHRRRTGPNGAVLPIASLGGHRHALSRSKSICQCHCARQTSHISHGDRECFRCEVLTCTRWPERAHVERGLRCQCIYRAATLSREHATAQLQVHIIFTVAARTCRKHG